MMIPSVYPNNHYDPINTYDSQARASHWDQTFNSNLFPNQLWNDTYAPSQPTLNLPATKSSHALLKVLLVGGLTLLLSGTLATGALLLTKRLFGGPIKALVGGAYQAVGSLGGRALNSARNGFNSILMPLLQRFTGAVSHGFHRMRQAVA